MNSTTPTYHYYIQDHQGNNLVVLSQTGTIEQTNHYCPFGMTFGEELENSDQQYKYNGKDLDRIHGLNLYDYVARHYDAAIFRWGGIDPLADVEELILLLSMELIYMDRNWSKIINMDNSQFIVRFLCSFFDIFHASIVEVRVEKDKVEGVIMYTDEDLQKFVWHYSNLTGIKKTLQLLDVLLEKKWIHNDRIITPKQKLIKYLDHIGWSNDDINDSIGFLSSLRIYMVDDGEETDNFIIHF